MHVGSLKLDGWNGEAKRGYRKALLGEERRQRRAKEDRKKDKKEMMEKRRGFRMKIKKGGSRISAIFTERKREDPETQPHNMKMVTNEEIGEKGKGIK